MNFRRFISHLLAILVIAGLVAAPLVTPAAANGMTLNEAPASEMAAHAMAAGEMSAGAAADDMFAMSADTPCCPDQQKKADDCQGCPLVATCMLKTAQAQPASMAGILVRHSTRELLV